MKGWPPSRLIDAARTLGIAETWPRLTGLVALSVASAMLELVGISFVVVLVASAAGEPGTAMEELLPGSASLPLLEAVVSDLRLLAAVVFGLFMLKALVVASAYFSKALYISRLHTRFARKLFASYMYAEPVKQVGRNTTELMRNINQEADITFQTLTAGLIDLASDVLVVVAVIGFLAYQEPLLCVALAGYFALTAYAILRTMRRKADQLGQRRIAEMGRMHQAVQEGLVTARELRLLGRISNMVTRYTSHLRSYARARSLVIFLQHMPRLAIEIAVLAGILLLAVYFEAAGYRPGQILATLTLFGVAAIRLISPVNRITATLHVLRTNAPAVSALLDDIAYFGPIQPADLRDGGAPVALEREIVFDDVSFAYPDTNQPAVEALSFTIERGQSVAFVGESGAGKSTVVDLIMGLLDRSGGTIAIDGRDIREIRERWQRAIGYIPQTIALVDDTIRRNVAYGLDDADIDMDKLRRALRLVEMDEWIDSLPQGMETVIGERGVRLSGGQRQRLGIARALYSDPPVLVLDEPTAAIDNRTEVGLIRNIEALPGDRTIIYIAHRLSTIMHCDRIFQMRHGRLIAAGRFEELRETNLEFRRFIGSAG